MGRAIPSNSTLACINDSFQPHSARHRNILAPHDAPLCARKGESLAIPSFQLNHLQF